MAAWVWQEKWANVVNTLDPQAVCLSGGLVHAWKAFSRKMIQIIMERSFVARHNKLRILATELMKNSNFIEAGVMGAASLAFIDALRNQVTVEVLQTSNKPMTGNPGLALKAVAN